MTTCEWDPQRDRLAQFLPPDIEMGCRNRATVSIGNGAYHLCAECAALPRFSRYRVRKALPTMAQRVPDNDAIPNEARTREIEQALSEGIDITPEQPDSVEREGGRR